MKIPNCMIRLTLVIACVLLNLAGIARGAISSKQIEASLSRGIDLDISKTNMYQAAWTVWFEISQSWQQAAGDIEVSPDDMRSFKFYSSINFELIEGSFPKALSRLAICKEIASKGNCWIVFNPSGMHLLHKSIDIDRNKYKEVAAGVFVYNTSNLESKVPSPRAKP